MEVYLKDGNVYWLDEPLEDAEAVWPLTEQQEVFLLEGGYADVVNNRLVIYPKEPEVSTVESGFITKREFLKKFTPTEYAAIKSATLTIPEVDYFWQLFMLAEEVSLTHPETIQGITMLEQIGLLPKGRASEILD